MDTMGSLVGVSIADKQPGMELRSQSVEGSRYPKKSFAEAVKRVGGDASGADEVGPIRAV